MTRPPMRILLLTTSLLRGGAETQVFLLARAFRARGHQVRVVSMLEPGGYMDDLAEADVEVSSLQLRRGVGDPRGITRFARVVRRWRPDVVHSHMVHANLLARVARPLAWAPVQVSTAHNITEGARWRELAYRLTDAFATITTNVCVVGAERYVKIGAAPAAKMRTMPNGIVIEAFNRPAEVRGRVRDSLELGDRFAWLAVGRVEPQKDYPNMFRAVARGRSHGSRAVVLVVGEGSLFDDMVAARDEMGLDDEAVRFLGPRSDVPELMAAADGYLMSSAWEGLPLVLIEASAARLPIVATDVGGNDEIVADGASGYLVPPHDPEALAAAMSRLEGLTPGELRAMGEEGLSRVRSHYEIERVVDGWLRLYQELLGDGRRR